jgi:hypothetical protein
MRPVDMDCALLRLTEEVKKQANAGFGMDVKKVITCAFVTLGSLCHIFRYCYGHNSVNCVELLGY